MTNKPTADAKKLKVVYSGGHDSELDNAIIKLLTEDFGYDEVGSGMMVETQERDLTFINTERVAK